MKPETPQLSRKQIDAELPDRLVDSLRDLIGAQRSRQLFRDRLVHVLTRYEVYNAATKTATRNEYRKQLSKLQEKAQGFLVAIRALHPEVRQTLNGHLDTMTWESRFEGFDLFDEKSVWPDDDSSFELAEEATKKIIESCHGEIGFLNSTKGAKKMSANPALDQLLIDLAALYETETDNPAKSHCYYTDIDGGYGGPFFKMAQTVLDEFVRVPLTSESALGNRIKRLLADD